MLVKQTFCLLLVSAVCSGDFLIPEIKLEAFTPKGFRASIADEPGLELFAFHGNINKDISRVDPGEYSQDFTSPSKGRWSYFNENLVLKQGDEVNFWIFIQHNKSGYRKDGQKWVVSELVKMQDENCVLSATVVSGQSIICKNSVIFEENFEGEKINDKKWVREEYIATNVFEDFEFLSYQKRICKLANNKLVIKPIFAKSRDKVEGELDLRNSCTRQSSEDCYAKSDNVFILPPVTSGRMYSRLTFRYGKVEIKATLPAGDWIYPQMYLEQVKDKNKKIWIGYVHGNDHLEASNKRDIGNTILYGGPVVDPKNAERNYYLKSYSSSTGPIAGSEHTFTIIWNPDSIILLLNNVEYGKIPEEVMKELKFSEDDTVRIVLGVGVGGVNDFPDGSTSGSDPKPWKNFGRNQVLDFFDARSKWSITWGDQSSLKVDNIKVTAL